MHLTLQELDRHLPDHLTERARTVNDKHSLEQGKFVLYWMRTAIRADENPALELAVRYANHLDLPVLVYQALTEKYRYASDRHHTFIMQGARDVQQAFHEKDIAYVFHLERPGQRGPHLANLASRSALVVTEDMPVDPLKRWTSLLGRRLTVPVIAVDTACVVPMLLVGKAYERAYAYRKATKKLLQERINHKSDAAIPNTTSSLPTDLPFQPVDFQRQSISSLVAECDIDHSISPTPKTIGGFRAGYQQWDQFKHNGLNAYAKKRNNPLSNGVSRLSPYLHYGMVSPMRIAREAAHLGGSGAEKFLDELLVWRELAYAFCFYNDAHNVISGLPAWARDTLSEHSNDLRPALLSWESLAHGKTPEKLWNAAQKSLLMHGELHNNVRMTWGKAILNWTKDAKQALATIIDLNHRYALDGRDPASYGGILWCLGQFDRPFPPARPIFGTVRGRSARQHAQRLDPQAYLTQTTRPIADKLPSIAVVGAGLSGLTCARILQDHGLGVKVFEKSRGPGGRMSTRRTQEQVSFDHGAQYFTARDERFRRYVNSWQHDGLVAPWCGRIVSLRAGEIVSEKNNVERFVGVPGMNAICKHLAEDVSVQYNTRVGPAQRVGDQHQLTDEHGTNLGDFDIVIVSTPAPQTIELLANVPQLVDRLSRVKMTGCWAVMLELAESSPLQFDGAFVNESPLSWVARNSSKPGRSSDSETWILHATPEWSEENLECSNEEIKHELIDAFWQSTETPAQPIAFSTAHRWRYALPTSCLEDRCLFQSSHQIGVCGDWCGGPRVEGAFLSGSAVAGQALGQIADSQYAESAKRPIQRDLF